MSDDLMKAPSPGVDGFESYTDQVENAEEAHNQGVIQGACVKFTNEGRWELRDGEDLSASVELVAVDIARVVQKWVNQQPVETRIPAAGEKFPYITELNEQVPKSEWAEGPDGKPRGPWQSQHIVYLLNPETMDRFTYPTGTTGGAIAVRDLVDKTNWMRKFRGAHVYPVVTLADTFMKTRFGGRQRPHFLIKRWVGLGGAEDKALPAPTPTAPVQPGAQEVMPPSIDEELNDRVPF